MSSVHRLQERGERRGVARKVRMKQIDVQEVAALNRAQAEDAAANAEQQQREAPPRAQESPAPQPAAGCAPVA